MTTAIFAGSFDPFTLGHMDLVERSFHVCDKLIIGIGNNPAKKTLFSLDERISLIENAMDALFHKVPVKSFDGLLVDFAREEKADILIRGVRSLADFEYEMTMAQVNKQLFPHLETVLLPANQELSIISSSLIKELAKHGNNIINNYCSPKVANALWDKFRPLA